ncbi:MAG: hypothetical protein PHQ96_09465 [Candidatus Omnitrophica bacterium]|nr:hypothetical protein [Candidatus Omnitrophota bacterium]
MSAVENLGKETPEHQRVDRGNIYYWIAIFLIVAMVILAGWLAAKMGQSLPIVGGLSFTGLIAFKFIQAIGREGYRNANYYAAFLVLTGAIAIAAHASSFFSMIALGFSWIWMTALWATFIFALSIVILALVILCIDY